MTTVILVLGIFAGAQEAGELNSDTADGTTRPAETELLFDEAAAEAEGTGAPDAAELPGVGFADFLRMVVVLALVIALIYLFVWLLKRFSSQKAESEEIINLLSTRPLKGDSALHLVEVGTRIFLVGSSGSSVNLISEIDDGESKDTIRMDASKTPNPVTGGFARMFRDKFGAAPAPRPDSPEDTGEENGTAGENADPGSFLRSQRERLKDL